MKKKFWVIVFAAVAALCLCVGLAACGKKDAQNADGNGSDTQTEQTNPNAQTTPPAPHVHSYGDWEVIAPATHTATGTRRKYCSCGEHIDESIPKTTEHEYGDWIIDTPATETTTGTKHKECPCGDRVTETIPLVIPFEFEQIGSGYTVKAYTGSSSEVTVPATYQEKAVTAIAQRAFYYGTMTQINLPETIVEIGSFAFGCCTKLEGVDIPNCARVGEGAFEGCSSLQEVVLPEDVVFLGPSLFRNCTDLTKITIGGGSVSSSIFTGCENVREIVLGKNVASVAQNTFRPCENLKSLTIPRIETSDTFMHYYFGISPEIYIKHGTEYVVSGGGLPNDIEPGEVERYSFGSRVFGLPKGKTSWYCSDKTIVVNGKTYTYSEKPIEVLSWQSCIEPTVGVYYYVPEKWTAEYYRAPETTLETLNISGQLINKTDEVFGDCSCEIIIFKKPPIVSMEVYGGNPEEFYPDTFYEQFQLHVEREGGISDVIYLTKDELSAEAQAELLEEGEHTFTVEKDGQSLSVTVKIVFHAFEGAKLESRKFDYDGEPKSLEVEGAPEGTEIVYTGNGQTEPGGYLVTATLMKQFYKTTTLDAILAISMDSLFIIENGEILGVTSAARNMTSLYLVSDSVTVTAIADNAFKDMTNLQSVVIASSILSIGKSAFSGCGNLQSVFWEGESELQTIGNHAFDGCSRLTSIEIPAGVTSIGNYAFNGCSRLTSIEIPDSVTSIESDAFV